jgi:hypothetical protein
MSKSLLESAADILNVSVNGAGKDPMQKGAEAQEVGGETPTESDLENLGAKAAAPVKKAAEPTTQGDAKSAKVQAMEETEADAEEVIAEEEEVELTEEEIDEYLNSLSEEELADLVAEATAEDESEEIAEEAELSEEEIAEARKAAIKDMVQKNMSSCKEDVDALFNGESLSEEFRTKATTIFEAAVRARVEAVVEEVVAENEQALVESYNDLEAEMTAKVDEYLNYVVENWMEENQLAVETGLRGELAEDFISGLKNLFAEHYINIPEEKADVLEGMAAAVTEAEEKLAEQAAILENTVKALHEAKAKEILRNVCEGLTEVQSSKIKALAEGVEFTSEGEYTEKLAVIRESYFPSKTSKGQAPQTVVETSEQPVVNDTMSHYVKAITKQLPR